MKFPNVIKNWLKTMGQALNGCNEHQTSIVFEKTADGKIKRTDCICSGQGKINSIIADHEPSNVIYQNTNRYPPYAIQALEEAIDDAVSRGIFTRADVFVAEKKRS